jgi:hypothetical protein
MTSCCTLGTLIVIESLPKILDSPIEASCVSIAPG